MGVGESLRRVVGYFGDIADEGYDDGETIRSPEESEHNYQERLHVHGHSRRGAPTTMRSTTRRRRRTCRKRGSTAQAISLSPARRSQSSASL